MTPAESLRARLITRFEEMPDTQENYGSLEGLMSLISYTEEFPQATKPQLKLELQLAGDGSTRPWPKVEVR